MIRNNKMRNALVAVTAVFFTVLISVVITMTLKNDSDMRGVLEDSVKSQLISTSIAAREILDKDKFESYNSLADAEADAEAYAQTLANLRKLQVEVGAQYIYALKQMHGKYYFIFDTDVEDEEVFIEYELSPVHEQAFLGKESADIMNVDDVYGSYNTGAVPIWKHGKVIGIISTDIEDRFLASSAVTMRNNAIILFVTVFVTIGVMLVLVILLLKRIGHMQEKLHRMANYDVITGLPNRQYLLNYLSDITSKTKNTLPPFALMFIDLDNFKKVNDGAGHDAGDELLRHISAYLDSVHEHSKAFRPAPGILNISARIGGDEFIQIVPGVATEAEAEIAAQKVLNGFSSQTLNRFIEKYQVGLSIGVALYDYHSEDYNVLIKYADIAMYHAKRAGKNTYRVYNDEMEQKDTK